MHGHRNVLLSRSRVRGGQESEKEVNGTDKNKNGSDIRAGKLIQGLTLRSKGY